MDLNMSPIFKQLLQSKIVNIKKSKKYYQQYNVKIIIAFHK